MKNKFLKTIGCLAAALALTACNGDETADGNRLPEGKYPVTFIATGLGTTAATHTTADGTWDGNEAVAVKIGDEVKNYVAVSSGTASTTLKPAEGVIPFYWQSTGDIKVSAWYLGIGYYTSTLPTHWSVQTNQNPYGYQKSDFLYAPQTDIDFKGTKPLTFYHQTAKVVINIRKQGGMANGDENIESVTINAVTDGDFTTTLTKNCGLSAKTGVSPLEINSYKLTQPNTVSFDGVEETALASYQALLIPQAVNNKAITINMKGYSPFEYIPTVPDQSGKWEGGTQYTYNLTIDGKEVKATVTSTIGWTDGGTGEGSVTLPDVAYDLSTATSPIEISDSRTYLITGSGSNTININGSPTVIFDGVTLNTSSSPSINITGGNPKLNFQGTNTLTTTDSKDDTDNVICLSNGATVTINGNGAQNTELKIKGNFGIGAKRWGDQCGNITISDIALDINCARGGVGSSSKTTCGDISLTNCKLNILTTDNGACIGASGGTLGMSMSICGNIELRDCEIINLTAKRPVLYYYLVPAAIGCSGNYAQCKNINIYLRDGENVDDFLTNITVDGNVDKVGKGNDTEYATPSVGTVTWYNHAGTKVDEGTKK